MPRRKFDINQLSFWPVLVGTIVVLAVAIPAEIYLVPGKGKLVAFSVSASLLAIYTSSSMLRYSGAKAFIATYVLLHIALVFMPIRDAIFPGFAAVPLFIGDYVAMIFGLQLFTGRSMD